MHVVSTSFSLTLTLHIPPSLYHTLYHTLTLDPLEESDVWMDEDLDAVMAPGISMQQQSPKYTRRFIDPLGLTVDESRISKKKSSQDLEQMFPHGQSHSQYTVWV